MNGRNEAACTPCQQTAAIVRLDEKAGRLKEDIDNIGTKCVEHHSMAHKQDTELTKIRGEVDRAVLDIEKLYKRSSKIKQYGPAGGMAGIWTLYEILRGFGVIG